MYVCKDIYKKHPATYLLHIKGYEWQMKEELTPQASQNLDKAYNFLIEQLQNPEMLLLKD